MKVRGEKYIERPHRKSFRSLTRRDFIKLVTLSLSSVLLFGVPGLKGEQVEVEKGKPRSNRYSFGPVGDPRYGCSTYEAEIPTLLR